MSSVNPPLDGVDGTGWKAGASSGSELVAVDGKDYSTDALKAAITAAKGMQAPIKLLLKYQGGYRCISVDYHGGLQYPHLGARRRHAGLPQRDRRGAQVKRRQHASNTTR